MERIKYIKCPKCEWIYSVPLYSHDLSGCDCCQFAEIISERTKSL